MAEVIEPFNLVIIDVNVTSDSVAEQINDQRNVSFLGDLPAVLL